MNLNAQLKDECFTLIAEAGEALDVPTYLIGGYVRDTILHQWGKTTKKDSGKDIDIVCEGNGIDLARAVAQKLTPFPKVAVYKNFGTALVKWEGYEIEFVGARKESYQHNSRKPVVEDGTLEDDFRRRDFTINALAVSLNKENYGEVIDPFEGLPDLKKELIRTPLDPKTTFSDDPLRMMRAIRFATELQFRIAPTTYQALPVNKERIKIVSQERITEELNKIILARHPSKGFKLLFNTGLLQIIFPELTKLQGIDVINNEGHKDNFYHTLQVLDNVAQQTDNLWLRWAALLHDIGKPDTKRYDPKQGWSFHGHDAVGAKMVPKIFKRLRLPLNHKMRYVKKLVRLHLRPISLAQEEVTDSGIRRLLYEAGDDVNDLMTLCRADITSKNKKRVQRYLKNFDFVQKRMEEVEKKDRIRNFQPPISGEVIMDTFNIPPSPQVGKIKSAIKNAILDGEIPNEYEAAYQFMLKKGKKMGLVPKKEKS